MINYLNIGLRDIVRIYCYLNDWFVRICIWKSWKKLHVSSFATDDLFMMMQYTRTVILILLFLPGKSVIQKKNVHIRCRTPVMHMFVPSHWFAMYWSKDKNDSLEIFTFKSVIAALIFLSWQVAFIRIGTYRASYKWPKNGPISKSVQINSRHVTLYSNFIVKN